MRTSLDNKGGFFLFFFFFFSLLTYLITYLLHGDVMRKSLDNKGVQINI